MAILDLTNRSFPTRFRHGWRNEGVGNIATIGSRPLSLLKLPMVGTCNASVSDGLTARFGWESAVELEWNRHPQWGVPGWTQEKTRSLQQRRQIYRIPSMPKGLYHRCFCETWHQPIPTTTACRKRLALSTLRRSCSPTRLWSHVKVGAER